MKELWICKGSTVQAWALLHHLGSDTWKEGEGLLGSHPTVLLILLPSTCCKNSPWVRKKILFWSVLQLLSNHYQTLREFSQWTGTPTSQYADRFMRNAPAQPQDGPSPNSSMSLLIFQTCFQAAAFLPIPNPPEPQRGTAKHPRVGGEITFNRHDASYTLSSVATHIQTTTALKSNWDWKAVPELALLW